MIAIEEWPQRFASEGARVLLSARREELVLEALGTLAMARSACAPT